MERSRILPRWNILEPIGFLQTLGGVGVGEVVGPLLRVLVGSLSAMLLGGPGQRVLFRVRVGEGCSGRGDFASAA